MDRATANEVLTGNLTHLWVVYHELWRFENVLNVDLTGKERVFLTKRNDTLKQVGTDLVRLKDRL